MITPRIANLLFQGEKQNATSLFERVFGGEMPAPFELSPIQEDEHYGQQ